MRLTLAALALCVALPLAAQDYTDPATGVVFPRSFNTPGGTQVLTGTAVRTKTFLKVKVYAYGLYVDQAGAKSALSAWTGKTAEQLQADAAFYQKLLERRFAMTMRLVMTRGVDGETMAEAFNESLGPRVAQAAQHGMPGGDAALTQFRGYFGDKVEEGTEMVFSCTPEGAYMTVIGGQHKPDIQSPALCWAIFDVYLGANPIMPDGKKTVIGLFPQALQ